MRERQTERKRERNKRERERERERCIGFLWKKKQMGNFSKLRVIRGARLTEQTLWRSIRAGSSST